jgi:MFS family permease
MNDGFTVTSAGVAVGMAAPPERQAGAQGLLGGVQTLMGGLAASLAGWSYDHLGRGPTFVITAAVMLACTASGLVLAGDKRWAVAPSTNEVEAAVH